MEQKFQLIRGVRILRELEALEELLAETTYGELERNTLNFTPASKKRQNAMAAVQIQNMEIIPYVNDRSLGINAYVNSIDSGNKYQPQMMFSEIEYHQPESEEEIQSPNTVTFKAANGEEYTISPISLSQNNVKVRCTCLDFRWRFAMYNDKDGSLFGSGPGLYQKKTQRPPNNPKGVPGLCKHLLKLSVELKNNQLVGS